MFESKIGWIFPIIVLVTIIAVICYSIAQPGF